MRFIGRASSIGKMETMNSFWEFALAQWQKPQVEALALAIQREHGPVVYFLLGAWLAERGQVFSPHLLTQIRALVAPVEAQLTIMRLERKGLTGEPKHATLTQELALEKQLYQQLEQLIPAQNCKAKQPLQSWWQHFFPQCNEAQFADWGAVLALD